MVASQRKMDDFLYRAGPWTVSLISHNWPVVVVVPLSLWAALRAYAVPSRQALLLLYGLVLVGLAFEYQKHGLDAIRGMTDYLFSDYANPGLRHASQLILVDLLPIAAYFLGLSAVILSLASRRRRP